MKNDLLTVEVIGIGLRGAVSSDPDPLLRLMDGLYFYVGSVCKFNPTAEHKKRYDRAWDLIGSIKKYQIQKTT